MSVVADTMKLSKGDKMERKLMKCGDTASGIYRDKDGVEKLVCVSCAGIVDGAYEVAEEVPSLEGRIATCSYGCGSSTESKVSLPFFRSRPDSATDDFYCGCFGWD
jgi:hypothetical protein